MLPTLTAPQSLLSAAPAMMRRPAAVRLAAALSAVCFAAALLATPAAAQGAPSQNDLQALLYYRQQGDQPAAAAELRRLQRQFPGWTPPENPDALLPEGPGAEIDAIFRLIADGDAVGARSQLAQTKARFAQLTPRQEMIRLLDTLEAQGASDVAVTAQDLAKAHAVVAAHPDLRRCDRVNNVWRLADLQAKAGERAAALASHRWVISACEDFSIVAASLEKAAASATAADLDALFALAGPRFADRTAEVSALRTRLLAGLGAPSVKTTPSVRAAASAAAAREDWAACLAATLDPRSISAPGAPMAMTAILRRWPGFAPPPPGDGRGGDARRGLWHGAGLSGRRHDRRGGGNRRNR